MKFFILMFLFTIGHALSWLQLNAGFCIKWFEGKLFTPLFLFGTPSGIIFMLGFKYGHEDFGSWGNRFIAFAASFLVWPVFNYVFLNESFFTLRSLTCFVLACLILLAQFKL